MENRMYDAATDLRNLASFSKKEFRDSYMSGRVRTSIALQMRALRVRLGLSQKEYAEKIGKPQSVVSRIENTAYGGVSVQTLLDVCEALDIALVMKFASFDEFLLQHGNISPSALAVETFDETVFRLKNEEVQPMRLVDFGTQTSVTFSDPNEPRSFTLDKLTVGQQDAIVLTRTGAPYEGLFTPQLESPTLRQ